jgi:small-conductance mechanosensitive channel
VTGISDWLGPYRSWVTAGGWIVAAGLFGLLSRSLLFRQARRLSAKTATRLDDVVLAAADPHWPWWFVIGALVPAAQVLPLSVEGRALVQRFAMVAFVLSLSLVASRAVTLWFEPQEAEAAPRARPTLLRAMARIGVLAAGALLVLDNLGLEITPLLTALGVGSLAVALALQPTLSNLFAGMHLSMARPIRVGDFVELENGTQGVVEDISWRTTSLRQPANNIVMVPNAKLADMVLKNYGMPNQRQSAFLVVGVAYDSDLDAVQRAALEVAREAQRTVPGAVPDFEPIARFRGFGDSAIELLVIVQAESFGEQFTLLSELVKRLHARFAADGIEIPFPQRVVHLPRNEATPLDDSSG